MVATTTVEHDEGLSTASALAQALAQTLMANVVLLETREIALRVQQCMTMASSTKRFRRLGTPGADHAAGQSAC